MLLLVLLPWQCVSRTWRVEPLSLYLSAEIKYHQSFSRTDDSSFKQLQKKKKKKKNLLLGGTSNTRVGLRDYMILYKQNKHAKPKTIVVEKVCVEPLKKINRHVPTLPH